MVKSEQAWRVYVDKAEWLKAWAHAAEWLSSQNIGANTPVHEIDKKNNFTPPQNSQITTKENKKKKKKSHTERPKAKKKKKGVGVGGGERGYG